LLVDGDLLLFWLGKRPFALGWQMQPARGFARWPGQGCAHEARGFLSALSVVLIGAALAEAADPPASVNLAAQAAAAPLDLATPPVVNDFLAAPDCPSRFWVNSEYLLWWIKDQPVPLPLFVVNDLGMAPNAGAPGSRVLFGGHAQDMGAFSGLRLTLGGWLNDEGAVGVEARGFLLEQRSKFFSFASDANGNPAAGFPTLDAATGGPLPGFLSFPGLQRGHTTFTTATQLWEAEANSLFNVYRQGRWDITLLGGFRQMNLHEKLSIDTVSDFGPVGASLHSVTGDNFQTSNRFYGGQLGTRVGLCLGRISAEATGKIALGSNRQEVNISGVNLINGALDTTTAGFFALPGAIGRQTRSQFSVIPEVGVKIGMDVTCKLRATLGYDFLYWTNVVRPGDQINNRIEIVGAFNRTSAKFDKTDFWAQGASFGLEFRY
jgi:hypothetical protein